MFLRKNADPSKPGAGGWAGSCGTKAGGQLMTHGWRTAHACMQRRLGAPLASPARCFAAPFPPLLSTPPPAGHAAIVRPYAQTNITRLLQRGPRVAQASTVNSPNTDMNLAAKEVGGFFLFLFIWGWGRRQAGGQRWALGWQPRGGRRPAAHRSAGRVARRCRPLPPLHCSALTPCCPPAPPPPPNTELLLCCLLPSRPRPAHGLHLAPPGRRRPLPAGRCARGAGRCH